MFSISNFEIMSFIAFMRFYPKDPIFYSITPSSRFDFSPVTPMGANPIIEPRNRRERAICSKFVCPPVIIFQKKIFIWLQPMPKIQIKKHFLKFHRIPSNFKSVCKISIWPTIFVPVQTTIYLFILILKDWSRSTTGISETDISRIK